MNKWIIIKNEEEAKIVSNLYVALRYVYDNYTNVEVLREFGHHQILKVDDNEIIEMFKLCDKDLYL